MVGQLGEKSPQVAIITNSDLPEVGQQALTDSDLIVVRAERAKAEHRARLGKYMIGETSQAKSKFSYVDMLNALNQLQAVGANGANIYTSSDLASKPEILSGQIVAMKLLFDTWQEQEPGKLAIVGSLLSGSHDPSLV